MTRGLIATVLSWFDDPVVIRCVRPVEVAAESLARSFGLRTALKIVESGNRVIDEVLRYRPHLQISFKDRLSDEELVGIIGGKLGLTRVDSRKAG